jgi:hypothetical protein
MSPTPNTELDFDDVRAAIVELQGRHIRVTILENGRDDAELSGRLVRETAAPGDDSLPDRYTLDCGCWFSLARDVFTGALWRGDALVVVQAPPVP